MAQKILVVEDEVIVGMDLVTMLEDWGYRVRGPFGTVDQALQAIASFEPDLAILDFNLRDGETSLPIAEQLHRHGTPFFFLTGCSSLDRTSNSVVANARRMNKPASQEMLKSMLQEMTKQLESERRLSNSEFRYD